MLGRLAAALCVALVALHVGRELGSERAPLRCALERYRASLHRQLARLHAATSANAVLGLQLTLAGVSLLGAVFGEYALAACVLPGCAAPNLWLRRARAARTARLERQLEAWLTALTSALASTPSLGDALASSSRLMDRPLCDELELVTKETALGMPLDDALERAAARVPSRTFRGVITTLKIARNTGGSLPTTLGAAADSLREMARLEGVVRTKTAEGRVQTIVLGALPAALYGLLVTLRPDHFEPMDHSAMGSLLYLGAGLLWVSAVLAAHRILGVDL